MDLRVVYILMYFLASNEGHGASDLMTSFLEWLLYHHLPRNCSLVMVHDQVPLPEPYTDLIKKLHLQWRPTLTIRDSGASSRDLRHCYLFGYVGQVRGWSPVWRSSDADYAVMLATGSVKKALDSTDISKRAALVWTGSHLEVHAPCLVISQTNPPIVAQYSLDGLAPSGADIFRESRLNLSGMVVRVSCRQDAPIITLKQVDNRTVPDGGRIPYLLRVLEHSMNMTVEVYQTQGNVFGNYHNGTWNGIIGDVVNGQADIGSEYALTEEVWHVLDFGTPFNFAGMAFLLYPRPAFSLYAFLGPFQPTLWVATGLGVALSVILFRTWFGRRQPLLTALRPLLEQGNATGHKSFLGAWFMFSIVIGTAYKSKLMAVLTTPSEPDYPNTFDDLAFRSTLSIAIGHYGGLTESLMLFPATPAFEVLLSRMYRGPTTFETCAKKALTEHYACIDQEFFLSDIVDYEFRDRWGTSPLVMADSRAHQACGSMMFRRGAALARGARLIMPQMFNMGVIQLWMDMHIENRKAEGRKRAQTNESLETYGDASRPRPLELHNLGSVFVLLFAGLSVSLIVIWCECYLRRVKCNTSHTVSYYIP